MNRLMRNERSLNTTFRGRPVQCGRQPDRDVHRVARALRPGNANASRDGQSGNDRHREVLVMELSGETFETTGEVVLTHRPSGPKMAFSRDSRILYVVGQSPRSSGPELHEMDLQSPSRMSRVLQLPTWQFEDIAVHSPSGRIFLSDSANQTIWVVNRTHFTIQWQIRLEGGKPGALSLSPAGDVLYVLSCDGESLWVIDPNSNRVLGRLSNIERGLTETEPLGDGSYLFVSHWKKNGGVCIGRVRARSSASRARTIFAVDSKGNCRVSRHPLATCLAA